MSNVSPIQSPRVATLRTVLQNVVSVLLTIVSIILVIPSVAPEIVEALRPVLPPSVYVWLVGVVAFIATLAGALARIMAIPRVNQWLSKFRLGYQPANR